MIAALYVEPRGTYAGLPGVEIWDEARDARKYGGPWPVVAHPPCSRWCRLAGLVEARWGHKRGDDGGCFAAALAAVRKWGGVLEHPAYSDAWAAHGLNSPPGSGGWVAADFAGGWTCHVEQGHYGHKARKPTWLYACQADLPLMIWGRSADSDAAISLGFADSWKRRRNKEAKTMSRRECLGTPNTFRDLLLDMARSVNTQRDVA